MVSILLGCPNLQLRPNSFTTHYYNAFVVSMKKTKVVGESNVLDLVFKGDQCLLSLALFPLTVQ